MKLVASVFALLTLAATPTLAQEQTVFRGPIESGGFGAPVLKFSEIRDQFAVFVGGRGGWIINHQLVIGGAGYGLANEVQLDPGFTTRDIEFGYGGLDIEYIFGSNRLVHGTVQALVGAGGITRSFGGPSDVVFVFEPQANIELNMTRNFRMNLGAGYRFVADVDVLARGNEDFSAPHVALTFKFGKF